MISPARRTARTVLSLTLLIVAGLVMLSGPFGSGRVAFVSPIEAANTPAATMTVPAPTANPGAAQSATPLADLFRKEPYLIYTGDPTQMEVLWQLTATATSTVQWGADTTYAGGSVETTEYGSDHQHATTLTGLNPGRRYFYRVTVQGIGHGGDFQTAPAAGSSSLKFMAYGDTRSYPATHDQVAAAMISTWTADPQFQTFALVVGDLVNTGTNETDWTSQFFSPTYTNIRGLLAHVPYLSCIGNHEGTGTLFVKYFPYPFVAGRYWSFDYGPAHFVIVDQYTSYSSGSAQLQWITNDLATTTKPWKFICLHEPGWSAGSHANNTTVQTNLQPLCVQYGVSIVFGGHNHYYSRAVVGGVHHVTTGGGGAPLYQPVAGSPNVVASAMAYHYCKLEIDGAGLAFQAVRPDGAIIDSFSIHQTSAVPPVDTAGSAIGASPNPFSKTTQLRWRGTGAAGECLLIVDERGRLIRRIPSTGPGINVTTWDGTDSQGRPAPPGVYFFRAGSRTRPEDAGRVILVR